MRITRPDLGPGPRRTGGERRGLLVRRGGGFTLMELLAVIVLASILAVTAAISLGGMPENRRAAAAQQIERDLAFARERAMATGVPHWVVFSPVSHSYSILAEDPANPGRAGAITIRDPATQGPLVQRLHLNEFSGVTITSALFDGSAEVGFDWLGRPLSTSGNPLSNDGMVQVTGGRQIFVLAGTGMVTNEAP